MCTHERFMVTNGCMVGFALCDVCKKQIRILDIRLSRVDVDKAASQPAQQNHNEKAKRVKARKG